MTSDDVRFTIERVRDPKVAAPTWRAAFEDVAAIETPDAATVRVRFSASPTPSGCSTSRSRSSPRPRSAAAKSEAEIGRHPVGSGPYRLESWDAEPEGPARAPRWRRQCRRDSWTRSFFASSPTGSVAFQAGLRGELDEFRLTRDETQTARGVARDRRTVPDAQGAAVPAGARDLELPQSLSRGPARAPCSRARLAQRGDRQAPLSPRGRDARLGTLSSGRRRERAGSRASRLRSRPRARGCSTRRAGRPGRTASAARAGRRPRSRCSIRRAVRCTIAIAEILRDAYEKVGVELRPAAARMGRVRRNAGRKANSTRSSRGASSGRPTVDPYPYFHSSQWPPGGENSGFYKNRRGRPDDGGGAGRARSGQTARPVPPDRAQARRGPGRRLPVGRRSELGDGEAGGGRRDFPVGPLPLPSGAARLASGVRTARSDPSARGRPRPRPVARPRGAVLHDDARRPRGARHQGRASRGRRRHARLGAAVPRADGALGVLPVGQPEQGIDRARSRFARGGRVGAPHRRKGRRARRKLSAGRPRALRPVARRAAARQSRGSSPRRSPDSDAPGRMPRRPASTCSLRPGRA